MSDKSEKPERLTFANIWDDYIESTGFHAVNKINFGRKHPLARTVFWIVLWLASASFLIYIVATELSSYYSNPTFTTLSMRHAEELQFPAITICNLSTKNRSMFGDDNRTEHYYLGITPKPTEGTPVNWSDPFYFTEGFFNERTIEDLYKESKQLNQFIEFHEFDLKDNYLNYTPVATDLRLCVRFNGGSPVTTPMYGGLYNLHVYIDLLLDDDYYPENYLSSGLKVAVHDQNEAVLMVNNGFLVPPASEASVEITRKQNKYLPSPYKAFENNICEESASNYSASKCRHDCLRDSIMQKCGCFDFMFESPTGKYCSKERYAECVRPAIWAILETGSKCMCPFACQRTTYGTKLSFGKFPSNFMSKSLVKLLNETEEHIKKNYVSLRIYYKNLQTTITEQKPKYENAGDIFSNVGGQMGLFLGASILTVIELGEFMLFVMWYFLVNLFKRNVVVYNGNEICLSKQEQKN
ncbi:acid-sensing ion channel 1-like [Mytilus edulis]|uniref:acid-sensing ion channel 1-like n=1 Tax=Mytilus edulis TaxID=6550 RepID=UPI0039EE47A9